MENKKLIVGNLKMNMVADEVSGYLKIINNKTSISAPKREKMIYTF